MRNPTTWFQLGLIGDAGPEITNGLGVFLYGARSEPGCGPTFSMRQTRFYRRSGAPVRSSAFAQRAILARVGMFVAKSSHAGTKKATSTSQSGVP